MLIDIITKSRNIFFYFVDICNQEYRFAHDLEFYKEIITMHRNVQDIVKLIRNDDFCSKLHSTLEAWDMNKRGAKLNEFEIVKESIRQHEPYLIDLYKNKLDSINSLEDKNAQKIIRDLEFVFCHLEIMKSKRRIVGVSKAMHFLLPDLVMPIDSTYTMPYFYGTNKYNEKAEKEFQTYLDIFTRTHRITKNLKLTNDDVDGEKWNTSIPKLIDNAIIGFDKTFNNYFNQFERDTVKKYMTLLKDLTELTSTEADYYGKLIEKQRIELGKSLRRKIREKLIIQKVKEAGITVSEEEINAKLAKKTN
ncbi:MAG: hypothetical protein ABSH06_22905 [Thermodesulfobacteriota bacterium]